MFWGGVYTFIFGRLEYWCENGGILVDSPQTLRMNLLFSEQVIILSEKGGLFGNCLCFNDSWSIAFIGQVEFC